MLSISSVINKVKPCFIYQYCVLMILMQIIVFTLTGNFYQHYHSLSFVPKTGIEPAHPCGHWLLKPACLPIPTPGPRLQTPPIIPQLHDIMKFMSDEWYYLLSENLRPLALESLQLLKFAKEHPDDFDNFDFVTFPLAKAYEVFLKDLLFKLELIDERTYNSKKLSIGRAINPDIRLEQRDQFWFYDDVLACCGEHTAREIWDGWLLRNRLIHLYPGESPLVSLPEAEEIINEFVRIISLCSQCQKR